MLAWCVIFEAADRAGIVRVWGEGFARTASLPSFADALECGYAHGLINAVDRETLGLLPRLETAGGETPWMRRHVFALPASFSLARLRAWPEEPEPFPG